MKSISSLAKIIVIPLILGFSCGPVLAEKKEPKVVIAIEGIKDEALNNVMSSLSLERQKSNPRLSSRKIKSLHKASYDEIKLALQALGYYHPKITSKLNNETGKWLVNYKIKEGPRVNLQKLEIKVLGEGKNEKAFKQVIDKFPLERGKPLRHDLYEKGKKDLLRAASELGFFEAKLVQHQVQVDITNNTAKGWITLETGPRYRFGKVIFPKTALKSEVLQNFVPFKEGEPFTLSKLLSLQDILTNTNYFNSVEVLPKKDLAQNHVVPILVSVDQRKRHFFTGGIGYSTDSGPRVSLGWDARYINDYGHRVNVEAKIAPVISNILGRYVIPNFLGDRDSQLEFNVLLAHKETDTSTSTSGQAGIAWTSQVWDWTQIVLLSYLYEDFEIDRVSTTSALLIPGVAWRKTVTDDPLFTHNGWRVGFDIRGAHESALSDTSFGRARFNGKYIRSLSDSDRLILRGDLGAMLVSDFDKLPSTLRFFAGGDVSVRGFDFEALGPKNDKNRIIGGRYLAVGSIEYEHYFLENWGAAVFADIGNAFNEFGQGMAYGYGVGARWKSPVGLVRADLAMGSFDNENTFRLHIILGPDL